MRNSITKRVLSVVLALMVVMTSSFALPAANVKAAATDKTTTATAKKSSKYSITLNNSTLTIKKGKSATLKATLSKAAKGKKVVWTTSNKKVATVNSKGKVTAKKKGTAVITAKIKGTKVKATCKVTVGTPASKIKVTTKNVSLFIGESAQITAAVTPKNVSNKKLSYETSNKKVATVSAKGVITAVAPGTAKITIKATDGSGKKATVKVTVKDFPDANAIALDLTAANVILGGTVQLTATVAPENAKDKTVAWVSSNPAVAAVDANGLVTGVSTGAATITATTVTGIAATCTVNVTATATTATELMALLVNPAAVDITYATVAAETVTIPAGDYSAKTLTINAPNATIVNNAVFKSVTVNQIADHTYTENAANTINYNAPSGHVVVGTTGVATINLATASSSVAVENNGTISAINVTNQVNLTISGTNDVPVNLSETATNTSIRTSVTLEIVSAAVWTMAILPGAENTTASVSNSACVPTVYGLGVIAVTLLDINDVINVNAIMRDDLGINQTATIKGSVRKNYIDEDDYLCREDATGATVYLIGYNANNTGLTALNYSTFITGAASTTVGYNGSFSFENVLYGNYWLVIYMDGYVASVQNVELVSNAVTSDGIFSNGRTEIISNEIAALGNAESISGTVRDGSRGSGVPAGITVKLRAGSNNITGAVVATTTTTEGGAYSFSNVPAGIYTIEALDLRTNLDTNAVTFNSSSSTILVAPGVLSTSNYSFTMTRHYVNSTISGTGQVQFTLQWSESGEGVESDLDSHLIGPSAIPGNSAFHIYFGRKVYTYNPTSNEESYSSNVYEDRYYDYDSDSDYDYDHPNVVGWANQEEGYERYANLDVDDTSYAGPEHTTIYTQNPGIYRFYVHNWSSSYTKGIYTSQARVTVNIGNAQQTYSCPDAEGDIWYVGYYNSTTRTFTLVNQMVDDYDTSTSLLTGSNVSTKLIENDVKTILDAAKTKKK